jgi:hypothetical protein
MGFKGTEVLVPAAATSLATLLGLPADLSRACRELTLRLASTATGPLSVGSTSAVSTTANRAAVLLATDTYPTKFKGDNQSAINLGDVWVIGTATAGDVIFVAYIT